MSKRWYQENKRDPWRRDARSKGYRARSAYKLKHIQERFSIIRKGDVVLDIGCHPGGWTQVASEEVGGDGIVIGVDLLATAPVDGATVIIGDITDDATIQQVREALDGRGINTVISDISPSLTGRYDTDQAISLELSTTVLDVAMDVLQPGGTFITKAFQGVGIEGLVEAARDRFSNVQRFAPTASRNSSSETYLICRNKLPRVRKRGFGQTAMEQVSRHLEGLGVLTEKQEGVDEERAVGLRRISRKEEE